MATLFGLAPPSLEGCRVLSLYGDSDALIRFDRLSEENEPVYFLDFMEEARALRLLAEAGLLVA